MRQAEPTTRRTPGKPRTYTQGEVVADGSVHVIGLAASVLGVVVLMIAAQSLPAVSIASLAVYGFGLVAVFACSAAYNLAREGGLKALLRRFDHAAIYIKIAGTYTPFAAIKMADAAGLALLVGVWAITAFGATAKLLWPGRLVRTSYVLYLAQGWAIVAAFGPLAASVSGRVLALLVVGGVIYTVGVVFHLWERLPYHKAVWHGLVLVASACHFAANVDAVGLTASS
jgi:hemolysin III